MQKSFENALKAAGLSGREVTPFMRVKVVGLISKCFAQKCSPRMGLITIWNPTEKQVKFKCACEDFCTFSLFGTCLLSRHLFDSLLCYLLTTLIYTIVTVAAIRLS